MTLNVREQRSGDANGEEDIELQQRSVQVETQQFRVGQELRVNLLLPYSHWRKK